MSSQRGSGFEKALWVVRDRITTRGAIDDLVADAVTRGIRDLVVQVRGRGDAYYTSSREPRAEGLEHDLDPLAHLVRAGAFVGVRIHAWGNVFYVWSDREHRLPSSPLHLARAHPDWLLRPDGEHILDPAGGTDWEGVYVDPRSGPGREHTLAVFREVVSGYAIEGFHYDFVRYPQARYAASAGDHEAVTSLMRAGARRLRSARSGLVLSAAVFPDPAVARDAVLQRWPDWAAEGLLDLVCPMAYRRKTPEVARILGAARAAAPAIRMWGGVMGYGGEPRLLGDQVRAAADAGCEGAILFSYDPAQRDLLDAFASA